jgi:hypothetical protein
MTVTTKIEPIASFFDVVVREDLSPQAQSKAVANFAREKLDEAQQANRLILGRVPPHTTAVDGVKGAALERVKPDGGRIVFEFELMTDVLTWIGKTLQERSPVVSGRYRRGHTLFADGREIRIGDQVPPAQEYSFSNTTAYARKIEIGRTQSGRAFVIQVPNRIYERTAKDARSRFGNIAKILFTYRGVVSGAQVNPARAHGRAHNAAGVRFPTIVVTPN